MAVSVPVGRVGLGGLPGAGLGPVPTFGPRHGRPRRAGVAAGRAGAHGPPDRPGVGRMQRRPAGVDAPGSGLSRNRSPGSALGTGQS